MSISALHDAVAGLGDILANGLIDATFAHDRPGRIVGVAHELLPDGTDREVAVVHAATYPLAQVAMHEELVRAGHGAAVIS